MYELYDWDAAHSINVYPTEGAALAVVASYIEANGREAVASWSLLRANADGQTVEAVAEGDDLAAFALDGTLFRVIAD